MRARIHLIATAAVAGAVGISLAIGIGQLTTTNAAQAKTSRFYTLRLGDRVFVPSVGQLCTVSTEGGATDLFCARPRGAHHQVVFFSDSILLWKVGNPDNPAWSGKP